MVPGIIVGNGGLGPHVGNSQSSHEDRPVRVNRKGNGSSRSITVEKHLPSCGLPGKFYPGLQGERRIVRVKPHSSVGIVDRHVLASLKMNRIIPRFAGGCSVSKSGWISWNTGYPHQTVDTVGHLGAGSLIEFKIDEPVGRRHASSKGDHRRGQQTER